MRVLIPETDPLHYYMEKLPDALRQQEYWEILLAQAADSLPHKPVFSAAVVFLSLYNWLQSLNCPDDALTMPEADVFREVRDGLPSAVIELGPHMRLGTSSITIPPDDPLRPPGERYM